MAKVGQGQRVDSVSDPGRKGFRKETLFFTGERQSEMRRYETFPNISEQIKNMKQTIYVEQNYKT